EGIRGRGAVGGHGAAEDCRAEARGACRARGESARPQSQGVNTLNETPRCWPSSRSGSAVYSRRRLLAFGAQGQRTLEGILDCGADEAGQVGEGAAACIGLGAAHTAAFLLESGNDRVGVQSL